MAKKDDDINAHVEKVKLIREASKSLSDYNKLLNETKELQSNINFITRERTALNKKLLLNQLIVYGDNCMFWYPWLDSNQR